MKIPDSFYAQPKPQKWVPTAYMKRAMRFLAENPGAGLLLDPGLRKTSIVLGVVKALRKAGIIKRVLVIAPLRVCYGVWPKEIQKWSDFNHLRCAVLHGPAKDAALRTDADVYVINPEGMPWLTKRQNWKLLKADTLVIDESTRYKDSSTMRFKILKPLLNSFQRRWILTGTFAPNGLIDLFGQMFVVDGGAALGEYVTHYRNAYFERNFNPDGSGGFGYKLREDLDGSSEAAEAAIYKRIKPLTLRLDAKDLVTLPEMIVEPIWVELPPAARKIYNAMERALVAALESGEIVTAVSAGVAAGKCAQIANGGLYHQSVILDETGEPVKGPRRWDDLHTAKIEAVMDLREQVQGQQILIAYDYAHDLARLRTALGKATPYLGGGVLPRRADAVCDAWNAGNIRDLLGHPASMGHGLNLQGGGKHIIWHSPTYNFEHWDQLNHRLLRSGSRHKYIFVYPVLARGTVDEAKLWSIERKGKTQASMYEALKVYIRERKR